MHNHFLSDRQALGYYAILCHVSDVDASQGMMLALPVMSGVRRNTSFGKQVTSESCCRLGTALTVSGVCTAIGPLWLLALDLLWEGSMPEPPPHAVHSHRLQCPPANLLLHTSHGSEVHTMYSEYLYHEWYCLLQLHYQLHCPLGMRRITEDSPGIALALSP